MIRIAEVDSPAQIEAVRALIREFFAWAQTFDPDAASAPTFHGLEAQLAGLPGIYGPPGGCLLLATVDGAPAGCVAFRDAGDRVCELKRMYVRPEFRGRRIGPGLVGELVVAAKRAGYRRMFLGSHHSMAAAHALYRAAGFRFVDAPANHSDPAEVVMEMDLV